MGISTPKKETTNKTWSDADLESALQALRRKEISANKAAKRSWKKKSIFWQLMSPTVKSAYADDSKNCRDTLLTLNPDSNVLSRRPFPPPSRYGIPSSTLYKIARKERIELAQPFNAQQTSWSQEDLDR